MSKQKEEQIIKTKAELIEILDKTKHVRYYYSKTWRYPDTGDDSDTCMFLKLMLENEYTSGTFIFIPDNINLCKIDNRNDKINN